MDRNDPVIHSNLQEQGFGVLEGMIAAAIVAKVPLTADPALSINDALNEA